MEVGVSGNMVVEAIFEVTQPGPTPLTLLKVAEFVRILTRAPTVTRFLETTERRSGNGGTLTRFRYKRVNGVECPSYGRIF